MASRPSTDPLGRWTRPRVAVPALIALCFLLHAATLRAYFVGDDWDFLDRIRRVEGLLDAARMTFWGEWEPAWYVSWYVDWRLWGLDPLGFHLTNVIALAGATVALYGWLRMAWPGARIASIVAPLFFVSHPLHDEAVTYLAARGHVFAVGLAVGALASYARSRMPADRPALTRSWLAIAGLLSLGAVLAKETMAVVPLWIGVYEITRGAEPQARSRWTRAAIALLGFALVVGASLWLRRLVVGLDSEKLTGSLTSPGEAFARLFDSLPGYALLGGLPLPFGLVDYPTLDAARPLGWSMVGLAVLLPGIWLARRRTNGPWRSPAALLALVGLTIAASSLLPVFWADLSLRRRYVFASTVGVAIVLAALAERGYRRAPRTAALALVLALVGGAAASLSRAPLWNGAGHVVRGLVEEVHGAPMARPAGQSTGSRVCLVTLPRSWGGDFLSGAYLLHRTDLGSALRLAGASADVAYALATYRAEDYHAEVSFDGPRALELTVDFRSERAFADARERDPARDARGECVRARLIAESPERRELRYRVELAADFGEDADDRLLLYSDGAFTRLVAPARAAPRETGP